MSAQRECTSPLCLARRTQAAGRRTPGPAQPPAQPLRRLDARAARLAGGQAAAAGHVAAAHARARLRRGARKARRRPRVHHLLAAAAAARQRAHGRQVPHQMRLRATGALTRTTSPTRAPHPEADLGEACMGRPPWRGVRCAGRPPQHRMLLDVASYVTAGRPSIACEPCRLARRQGRRACGRAWKRGLPGGGLQAAATGAASAASSAGASSTGRPRASHSGRPPFSTATLRMAGATHVGPVRLPDRREAGHYVQQHCVTWRRQRGLVGAPFTLQQAWATTSCTRYVTSHTRIAQRVWRAPVVAKRAERPPHARRAEAPAAVVHHDV